MLNLFSPLMLGRLQLPNRIAMSALPSGYATPNGFVSDVLMSYYLERAHGGPGLLVIEPAYVCPPSDVSIPHLGIYADAQVPALHYCITLARGAGPVVLVMLDQPLKLAGLTTAAVAAVGEAFVVAAWRAHAAGAHGVMFSCADGGPFEELVSPLQNRRDDRYGGSLSGRLRLLLGVVESVHQWLGDDFIIGVRLNVEEFAPGGLTLQDARVIAKRFTGAGVRLLEVSTASSVNVPIAEFPGWRVPLAAGIRAVVDVPVMVGGLLQDALMADSVIREAHADLVALGDTLRSEPGWPAYARGVLHTAGGTQPGFSFPGERR